MWSLSRPLAWRFLFLSVLVLVAARPATATAGEPERPPVDPSAAVVKLYVAAVSPSHDAPWRAGRSYGVTGSGAVIEGGRILTNAHVVQGQTFIQVRPNGSPGKYPARVLFVSHAADLALLEVEAPAFHAGVQPIAFGELPAVRDRVSALGFPNGGETLSVTDGVVARVEHETYLQSWESLLSIQMDAAIAPGSSGGPVVRDGLLVGVAMQGFKENPLGCAIPVTVVRQFLADVSDGRYDGIPTLGVGYQTLENPALKRSLGVAEEETGVLVKSVPDDLFSSGGLQEGDVLLAVDGRPIADDGTIEFRPRERTSFQYALDLRQVGDQVRVRYRHAGAAGETGMRLTRARGEGRVVPRLYDGAGDYYVYGGLVFATATWNYAMAVADRYRNAEIQESLYRQGRFPGEELVVVADVLQGDVNRGYEGAWGDVVESVDGEPVRNLAHLVELVEKGTGEYVTFRVSGDERVTLARAQAVAANAGLLQRYGLSTDRSPGLVRAVQTAGTAPAIAAEPLRLTASR